MKEFRGYVSRAQEGILSQHPEAQDFDSVPSLAETRQRAHKSTLQDSLRAEEMEEGHAAAVSEQTGSSSGPSDSIAPADGKEAEASWLQDAADRAPGAEADALAACGTQPARKPRFTARALCLALLVNVLLGCLLALIMVLDAPKAPPTVYYIDLTDRPADAVPPSEGTVSKEQNAGQGTAAAAAGEDAAETAGEDAGGGAVTETGH